jgi:hypothetical protein
MNPLSQKAVAGAGGYSKVLTTQSYTGYVNTTWVAPAGVTSLVSLEGKGASGVAGYWSTSSGDLRFAETRTQSATTYSSTYYTYFGTSATYQDVIASIQSIINTANALGSGDRTFSFSKVYWMVVDQNSVNYYGWQQNQIGQVWKFTFPQQTVRIKGTVTRVNGYNAPTTGNITSAVYYYNADAVERYVDPTTGSNATAFGKTFTGGTGGPASTVTYTNVSVTPGTSYSIYCPDSTSTISFSYLV